VTAPNGWITIDGVVGAADANTESLLAQAQEAVEAGEWATAKRRFEAVLTQREAAEALFGLGVAEWWLGETRASLRHHERAYALFHRAPDPEQALLAAFWLCLTYRMSLGNFAASRGWLGRAASLVDEFDVGPLSALVLIARADLATETGRPDEAEQYSREALRIAREAGEIDLELCALSELGAALVELGRVDEGTGMLDEAMVGALAGDAEGLDSIVLISCRTITSCSRAGDLSRATQWVRAADEFHQRFGSLHLYTTCRTAYGSVLFATGEWELAEVELLEALKIGESAEPALHVAALAQLAELRLAQGRLEEASRLLVGYEDHPAAIPAIAALHLVRGDHAVASSLIRRRLGDVDRRTLTGARLLELLGEAEIACGDRESAAERGRDLVDLGTSVGSELIVARGECLLGRASGDAEDAITHLGRALSTFREHSIPLGAGRARLQLARVLVAGEREAAVVEARGALELFEALGAARDADEAAGFLREQKVKAARTGPRGLGILTRRELDVLALLGEGLMNTDIAERLFISRKTVEHHVASVLAKLQLGGRGEATAYAIRTLDTQRGPTPR
jgi:ATP/maltotriose-dependent transcriptional regulator MalT